VLAERCMQGHLAAALRSALSKIFLSLDKSLVLTADWMNPVTTAVAVHSAWSHPAARYTNYFSGWVSATSRTFSWRTLAQPTDECKRHLKTQISWRPRTQRSPSRSISLRGESDTSARFGVNIYCHSHRTAQHYVASE
jgi:hypothetical protein